jgi:hypothetical protein
LQISSRPVVFHDNDNNVPGTLRLMKDIGLRNACILFASEFCGQLYRRRMDPEFPQYPETTADVPVGAVRTFDVVASASIGSRPAISRAAANDLHV